MLAEKFSYASSIAENGRDMNEYLYTHKGWIEELIFRLSILSVIGLGFYSLAKNIRKTNKIIFYVFILLQCWMLMHALISYSVWPKFIISELHGAKGPLVWLSLSLIFISLDPNNWNYIKKILLVLTNIAAVIVLYKVVFEFPGFIFGSIEGTNELHLRKLSALQTAALPVDGFVISGICSGESSEERDNILSTILPLLPDEKCRAISSVTSPLDILNAIHHGVDVIQSDYATVLSNLCYASVFSIPNSRSGLVSSATRNIEDWRPKFSPCGTQVAAPSKLNLRDKQFERDQQPLLIGCTCYTCKHYMRAYLHHLLNVRELLGNTLLHIHNLHHLNKLVECTRESIYYGSFLVFWKEFKRSFQGGFQ